MDAQQTKGVEMATKMYVECIKKPSRDECIATDVTVGKIYPVKWIDESDYQIIDDKKKVRYYRRKFFKNAEQYLKLTGKE